MRVGIRATEVYQVKAMLAAGKSVEEIAKELLVDPACVESFAQPAPTEQRDESPDYATKQNPLAVGRKSK